MKRNKGITLIALIITIIILLILVTVSINLVINGDLVGSAQKAVNGINEKIANQQSIADELIKEFDENEEDGEQKNETGAQGTEQQETEKQETEQQETEKQETEQQEAQEVLPGTRVSENTKYVRNEKTAWIPKGFTVSEISTEQSIENGLVIYDIPEGTEVDWTNPDSVKTKYNQFVWIPVEVKSTDTESSIASFYITAWTENKATGGERITGLSTTHTEPDSTNDTADKTGIADQIEELTKSIYKYGGFYIGRYEAGVKPAEDGTSIPRTSSSSQTEEFVVQQDKYPYYYVKCGKSMSDVSEGAVYLCNNLYLPENTNYGATSMLCTGAGWDSMLDFIKDSSHSVTDSTTWGNYANSETYKVYRGSLHSNSTWNLADTANGSEVTKSSCILLTTGATERNSSKNIYDVAGNCSEWTTESISSSYRVFRGRRSRLRWF